MSYWFKFHDYCWHEIKENGVMPSLISRIVPFPWGNKMLVVGEKLIRNLDMEYLFKVIFSSIFINLLVFSVIILSEV